MVYRGVERKRSGTGIKNVSLNWKLSLIFFFFLCWVSCYLKSKVLSWMEMLVKATGDENIS